MRFTAVLAAAALAGIAVAQDPAEGWMGYATTSCPAGQELTHVEMSWKVGATPRQSDSFYSPWFGIEASDNLNLLQPVNPWLGNSWDIYNEYFQWSPEYNFNSADHEVNAGQVLFGEVTLTPGNSSYTITHSSDDGWSVTNSIPIQKKNGKHKQYTIVYVVYEKVCPCGDYPPDGQVTFTGIKIECNGTAITPTWTTAYVDDNCNNRAHVVAPDTIQITWDVNGVDPSPERIAASKASGKRLGRRVPAAVVEATKNLRGN